MYNIIKENNIYFKSDIDREIIGSLRRAKQDKKTAKGKRTKLNYRAITQKFYGLRLQREYYENNKFFQEKQAELKKYWAEIKAKDKDWWNFDKKPAVSPEKLQDLEDGTYILKNNKWLKKEPRGGYAVEVRKFKENEKLEKGENLGIWHDKADNDKLYIGISKIIKSRKKAEELGRILGERAIWDFKGNSEIRL